MFVTDKSHGEKPAMQHPSLEGFIWWLEQKPKDGAYDWRVSNACACAQYGGATDTLVWWQSYGETSAVWHKLNAIACGPGRNACNWTFGKCLQRARKAA